MLPPGQAQFSPGELLPADTLLVVLFAAGACPDDEGPPVRGPRALLLRGGSRTAGWRSVALPVSVLRAVTPEASADPTICARAAHSDPDGGRGSGRTWRGTAAADGERLRLAVLDGWAALGDMTAGYASILLGVHHELAQLPWQLIEDEPASSRVRQPRVRVFHGVNAALRAAGAAPRSIAPPSPSRPLGVLAHSPAQRLAEHDLDPILGVHADLHAVRQSVGSHCEALEGRNGLLGSSLPLVLAACHGRPEAAYTGPGAEMVGAHELRRRLRDDGFQLDALILMSCCTARASDGPWGEAGGWPSVLQDAVSAFVGPLHPVDDLLSSLFVTLLLHHWNALGDLHRALVRTRAGLRTGQWSDDDQASGRLARIWLDSLAHAGADEAALRRARSFASDRLLAYGCEEDSWSRRLRLIASTFVIVA